MCLAAIFLSACGSKSNENGTVTNPAGTRAATDRPLNPPHGTPGHTCAVPDGAPIPEGIQPSLQNSAPLNQEAPRMPVEANKTTNINPAHGLPGHRCDLAVGAPL